MVTKKISLANIAKKADAWAAMRKSRLDLEKQVVALKKKETDLYNFLIDNISAADTTGVSGKAVRVWIERDDVPVVEDEAKFRQYINRHKRFDLCQKLRPAAAAVKEMWANGKKVPGVNNFQNKKLRFQTLK